jgi:thioesterase domain-containing protein
VLPLELGPDVASRLFETVRTTRQALDSYQPAPYPGRLALLLASHPGGDSANGRRKAAAAAAWAALAVGGAEVEPLPGDHYSIMRQPAVGVLAKRLRRRLTLPST